MSTLEPRFPHNYVGTTFKPLPGIHEMAAQLQKRRQALEALEAQQGEVRMHPESSLDWCRGWRRLPDLTRLVAFDERLVFEKCVPAEWRRLKDVVEWPWCAYTGSLLGRFRRDVYDETAVVPPGWCDPFLSFGVVRRLPMHQTPASAYSSACCESGFGDALLGAEETNFIRGRIRQNLLSSHRVR